MIILKEVANILIKMNNLTDKIANLVSITYEASHDPRVKTKIVNPNKESEEST